MKPEIKQALNNIILDTDVRYFSDTYAERYLCEEIKTASGYVDLDATLSFTVHGLGDLTLDFIEIERFQVLNELDEVVNLIQDDVLITGDITKEQIQKNLIL